MLYPLRLHPDCTSTAVTRIEVNVAVDPEGMTLQYVLSGDIDRLRLPTHVSTARRDNLWQHTCCEAFVADADGYTEWNFSPSFEWAAYRFTKYRRGMSPLESVAPRIETIRHDDRLILTVTVPGTDRRAQRLGLTVVVEEIGGHKSYWALRHAPGKPDFHRAECFVATLTE